MTVANYTTMTDISLVLLFGVTEKRDGINNLHCAWHHSIPNQIYYAMDTGNLDTTPSTIAADISTTTNIICSNNKQIELVNTTVELD
mmetsp:Transcript_17862/g.38605  ORF Transcript_17862/g.38605 Transcript_17862/m.38605 type:complete len:87 (+) Transcript_17862:62-322(+)